MVIQAGQTDFYQPIAAATSRRQVWNQLLTSVSLPGAMRPSRQTPLARSHPSSGNSSQAKTSRLRRSNKFCAGLACHSFPEGHRLVVPALVLLDRLSEPLTKGPPGPR